jgi:hypothetical protein
MKNSILLYLLVSVVSISYSQINSSNKFATQKINSKCKLVFLKYEKVSNLYSNPRIIFNHKIKKIKGFDVENYSSKKIKISPNKKYFVMDYIIKVYIYNNDKDSTYYENYKCVIIDVKQLKIVQFMQSDCGGEWNSKNQWVNNDAILFE